MNNRSQYAKAVYTLIAFALFVSGCTKTRDASLPEDAQENIFAISEFGEIQTEKTPYKVKTDERLSQLSLGEASKATAEKGVVAVTGVEVPERLKFMFKGLEMTGQAGATYPITLSVDKQFVTAYKIVSDLSQLSILEKQLAQVKSEVLLQKQIQRSKDNSKIKSLMASLKDARSKKVEVLSKKTGTVLVPLFKFKVKGFGVLQRAKNELKEETSTLRLKATDWTEATHIVMDSNASERMMIGIDPASTGELDRTFVMDRVNNKIMTASTLKSEYQVPVNIADDSKVLTLLDVDALHVFEIGPLSKMQLTDSQLQQLKMGSNKSNVRQCSSDIVKALPAAEQKDCVMVLRYDVPVSYVKPKLPTIDYEGNQDAKIAFEEVRARENVGLVKIGKEVQPKKIENNNEMDPRTTLRVADIKNKEFFFRRTLQDAPVTTMFPPGMSGELTIIKFEMAENRLVVRKADKMVQFKSGSNDTDYEEIMSIPVKYFKHDTKDASGADYSLVRMVPASRSDAEYIEIDWTGNKLSGDYSPYKTLQEYCIKSVADAETSDVDMKMDRGVLNFSINYSVGLDGSCITDNAVVNDYNGTSSYQTTARMKERVSFKVNDGSTNQSFVPKTPFRAQNELGYGVWTIGQIKPTDEGLIGREGQEENLPVVHDFRNGKKLVYTVTGLEASVDLKPEIRALYRETITDVVNAWDLAYKQAFKGTFLERSGRYVEVQFSGDGDIQAVVGDLNSNIVHFENKFNYNHGILGVSQVGYNPRSGIVVADSLIIYAGNLQQFVASSQRDLRMVQQWDEMKEQFRQSALDQLTKQQQAQADAEKAANKAASSAGVPEQKVEAAKNFTRQLMQLSQGRSSVNSKAFANAKKMNLSVKDVRGAVSEMKALGFNQNQSTLPDKLGNMNGIWLDRAFKKLYANPTMDEVELQGVIAEEMLKSDGAKMSTTQKAYLQKASRMGAIRGKMNEMFKNAPGCMLTARESLGRDFAKRTFLEALREELYFDIGHEMGHSQGLTHNFIGSFDKVNFTNEDGSASKRNYSSIMDYIEPGKFQWDGIGAYDVHALRASHLGLFEVSPAFKAHVGKQGQTNLLVNGKFLAIDTIKASFAKQGWNNFTKRNVEGVLKPYKYCTDIHVGYEPMCQRFDYGTSALEIVQNIAKDYEQNYVTNYYSWDRNNFGIGSYYRVIGRSMNSMYNMRQFLDELFYMAVLENTPANAATISDLGQASFEAYKFFNQLIRTPDATSGFLSGDRFVAVPYQYDEVNAEGKPTGKKITDVQIVEKRALQNTIVNQNRLDTIGIEYDKVMAMNFLTMKGFPSYKYYSQSIIFSYLDFEKYFMGMSGENSLFANTVTQIMLDQLSPTFSNDRVTLSPVQGAKSSVTAAMRSYAGIYGILNLEASTLRDKDNYANFFKVGSSVGGAVKKDRIALSNLGVSNSSESRLSFWALDNAIAADNIIKVAANKAFFIENSEKMSAAMENLVLAQIKNGLSQGKAVEGVDKAKKDLVDVLTAMNKNGDILSAQVMAANPSATIANFVENIANINMQFLTVSMGLITQDTQAAAAAAALKKDATMLSQASMIYAFAQNAMVSGYTKVGEQLGKQKGFESLAMLPKAIAMLVDVSTVENLEVSYGIIVKNLEFLNMLTNMTNPEYAR